MAKSKFSRGTEGFVRKNHARPRNAPAENTSSSSSNLNPSHIYESGPASPEDLKQILASFSDSLGIIETACEAFEALWEDCERIAPAVSTLRLGLAGLNDQYVELDLAISSLNPSE
jgi:hypothetical protein